MTQAAEFKRLMESAAVALTLCLIVFVSRPAAAQSQIVVGDPVIDPPTVSTLGFSVPIISGDDNYSATATVTYKRTGSIDWQPALPLLRVRPETTSDETPPENYGYSRPGEQFAGSIFGLEPETEYDVRINVADTDGGSRIQDLQVTTLALPRVQPTHARTVRVTTSAELDAALQDASAGDVISLASGTYVGRFDLTDRQGTARNPIVIRGDTAGSGSIIDGSGQSVALKIARSAHVHIEHLRLTGVSGTLRFALDLDGQHLVARKLIIDSDNGIDAGNHQNRNFYICDNQLSGPTVWPVVAVGSNVSEKNWIGITVRGQGHTVCHNSVSNFGSSVFIGFRGQSNPLHNIAIDLHNNDIGQSADDGIELDGSTRNVRVWNNRIKNSLMGISFSPVWGGPVYAIRNLVYNAASAPFKLNNNPSGVFLYHNTAFRYAETDIKGPYDGNGWPQLGESFSYAANTTIVNNIMVGNDSALFVRQRMPIFILNNNGYWPNGTFGIELSGVVETFANIAAFRSGTGFELDGTALQPSIFQNPPPTSPDYKILGPALDFVLDSQSNAVDAGAILPNVNDDYVGLAPDLGAAESGAPGTVYGARNIDIIPPEAPSALSAIVQ